MGLSAMRRLSRGDLPAGILKRYIWARGVTRDPNGVVPGRIVAIGPNVTTVQKMDSIALLKDDNSGAEVPRADSAARLPFARVVALYLPQYHPIPENNEWWGPGFTEWTNVAKARPLYPGHYQPHIPADLGFYDLRLPEAREAQATLARAAGVEAFCYYHYWFGGREILERPFREVLRTRQPRFPFCLCWANQTWTGIWHGAPNRVLIEQTYPGEADHRRHFDSIAEAFLDDRYMRVDGKPVFVVYRAEHLPDARSFTDLWRKLAQSAGLPGLFFIAENNWNDYDPRDHGFDAEITQRLPPRRAEMAKPTWKTPRRKIRYLIAERKRLPTIHQYQYVIDHLLTDRPYGATRYPSVIPNWDNTPRSGGNGLVLHGSTPELFRSYLRKAIQRVANVERERRIIFIKSWNEWAEGNYLEPDIQFGHEYLDVLKEELLVGA